MRLTYTHIRGGQPGPYQDTENVNQVLIEESDGNGGFVPWNTKAAADPTLLAKTPEGWPLVPEFIAKRWARVYSGWHHDRRQTDFGNAFDSYLDYCRQIGPGLVEWRVVEPFTD